MDVFEWKATARTGAPNVKQHYLKGGGAFHVVHEEGAPDPVPMDEVGARFLGLVLSLAQTGARLRLSTLEGGAAAEKALGEGSAVEAALRMCLRGRVEEFREYHRLIDPAKLRVLDALGDAWAGTSPGGLLASTEAQERVMVVSSMCGNPVPMIGAVGSGGAGAAVLRPRESWLRAPSLGKAMLMYHDAEKRAMVLRSLGVRVYSELRELVLHLKQDPR